MFQLTWSSIVRSTHLSVVFPVIIGNIVLTADLWRNVVYCGHSNRTMLWLTDDMQLMISMDKNACNTTDITQSTIVKLEVVGLSHMKLHQ